MRTEINRHASLITSSVASPRISNFTSPMFEADLFTMPSVNDAWTTPFDTKTEVSDGRSSPITTPEACRLT